MWLMTWSGYCLLLWLLCWIGLPQHACSGSRDAELATKVKQWEQLAKDSFDSTRKTHLTNILSNQAGIYVDSSHALREGRLDVEIVQKSVIVLTIESIPKALLDHLISSSKATPSAATSTLLQQKHHQAPEAQDKEERLERYMQFLFNLLCYFKHHQLKALLFVNFHLPSTSANSSNSANNSQRTESQHSSTLNDAMIEAQIVLCDSFRVYLQSVYQHVDVVSYPDYLFWSYVARKTRPIESGRGKADYEGFDIRYQRFGALPMLIPSMEVISLGFHVIYFDVDMVFLDDPIPHLLHNARRVDIVVSPELRTCEYPSFSYDIHWSLHMEANTGIMFVKSSTHSLKYIDTWLMRNVEENVHNDQRVMGLHVYEGSTWVKDCDRHYDDQMEVRRHEPSPSPTLRYCFTSEFQFFNGYMEFFCHQHKHTPRSLQERDIQRSVFDYTMYFYGNKKGFPSEGEPRVGNLSITAQLAMMNSSIRSFQQQQKQHVTSKKKDTIFFYPVVLHVNYCDHKRKELESRGLWLLQQDRHNHTKYQCQAFNLYQTEYAKVDFATKLTLARDELEDMLKKSMWSHDNLLEVSQQLKSNVSLLTWPTQASWMVYFYKFLPNYYYYDAGYLRPITDMSNLLLLGKDAKITVQRLSRKAHQIIPYGQSIALEPHIEHLTCAAQHHRHQYQALPMYLQQHLKHHADVVQKLALKDQKLLPLMDAKQGTSQSSSTNTSTNEHMIPLPLLKLQQDAMKLSQAFKLDNRWENLKSLLQEVTKKQVDRFHNQSMYSKIENKPAIKQAYLDFYSKTVFVHILRIQKSTALYQELLQNYICMAKEHDLVLVIYLLELDPQRFEEHAKAIMALSEHIHVIDYPYALYWQMVGKKSMQSLGPVQFRFIDVHFKNVGFVLMVIPMYEILQLGYNVLYLDLDIGLLRNPVPYLVHSDADLILSAELRTCHFDSILHDAKATTTLKLSELNTGILFAKSNPNTLKLYETWILAIVNQGIVNDQKALRIGDFGGMQVFDCNPLLPREVVQQHYSKPVTDNKLSNPTVKFCVLNDLLFQNGRVSQCAINKEGSQAEYTMAMIGTVILDLFFGPEESYDPRYDIQDKDLVETRALIADLLQREANASITTAAAVQTSPSNTANNPQYLHPRFALPTFPFLHQTILLMQTLLHKLRIMPVAVHANYCDHKKPWLEEKGMWLVKSFDTNKPCLRCLKLNLDGTWFASHPWEDSLRNALKELKDIRNIRINSVVKMSKFREIFLVTNDSFRPFANGEVFLAKGYQWKDIQKISHPYFYFLDKGIGAVVLNDTSLVSTEGLPQ